jgi:hypothetical protein
MVFRKLNMRTDREMYMTSKNTLTEMKDKKKPIFVKIYLNMKNFAQHFTHQSCACEQVYGHYVWRGNRGQGLETDGPR